MVRSARRGDARVIAGLLGELGYPASDEAVLGRLAALGPDDLVLVSDDGAGLIALHRIPRLAEGGAFVRITAVVVHAEERGRGVARALLAAAEEAARHWGCDLIEVSSGRHAERAPAHQLYRAAGFTDTAQRSVRYWKRVPAGTAED
jgi:GNAT superfamily N-acetyltransferase